MLKEVKILTFLTICSLVSGQSRQNHYGNSDSSRSSPAGQRRYKPGPGISVKLARKINSMNSTEEFLKVVYGEQNESTGVTLGNRFGGVERSNAIEPIPAGCEPELKSVPFDFYNNDSSIFYFPSCTRIKQCGGCCGSLALRCEPTESVTKNFEVYVNRITTSGYMHREKTIIPLEEHTSCDCKCRIKREDCIPKQVYNEDECSCICTNVDEESKCDENQELKYWDSSTCSCQCYEIAPCFSNSSFNPDTCRCERRRTSSFPQNRKEVEYRSREPTKSHETLPIIAPVEYNSRRRSNKDDPEYK